MSIKLFRLELWTGRCKGASVLGKRVCAHVCDVPQCLLGAARPFGVAAIGGTVVFICLSAGL